MHVLFHFYVPGNLHAAGNLQSFRVCYFLARAGADVHLHVCTRAVSSRRELLAFFGFPDVDRLHVTFHRQPFGPNASNRALRTWGALFHLRRLLKLLLTAEKRRYDVFLARGYRFPALHVLLKKFLGYRVVFEIHELNAYHDAVEADLLARGPLIDLEAHTFRHADGVISISRSLLDLATKKWGTPSRSTVIPSGAESFESVPLPADRTPKDIYYVGNIYPLSGVEHAIDAVAGLANATLTIVGSKGPGDSNHERLAARIETLGATDRISLLGFVDPARLPETYARADILIAPYIHTVRTAYFSSPLKIFEYMHAHRPMVVSDLPTIREILTDGKNALLVPPEDADALRSALARLIATPDLGRVLADTAKVDAERYTLDRKCRSILEFLQSVVHRARVVETA